MMRNILNYVWENIISLYRMFEDQTCSVFSIFLLAFSFDFSIDLLWYSAESATYTMQSHYNIHKYT